MTTSRRRKIKKGLTVCTCVVIIFAIVALCAVAYYKDESSVSSKMLTFVTTDISHKESIKPISNNIIQTDTANAEKKAVYIPASYYKTDKASKGSFYYNCTITNTGDKPIVAYVAVNFPVYVSASNNNKVSAERIALFQPQAPTTGKWAQVKKGSILSEKQDGSITRTIPNENQTTGQGWITYVYAYAQLLQPGEETPELKLQINVQKFDSKIVNKYYNIGDNKYIKTNIRTTAVGVQDPTTYRATQTYTAAEYYFWSGTNDRYAYGYSKSQDRKIVNYLKDIWNTMVIDDADTNTYDSGLMKYLYNEIYAPHFGTVTN